MKTAHICPNCGHEMPVFVGEHARARFAELPELQLEIGEAREAFERRYFVHALAEHNGNITHTARAIGMDRASLHRRLRQLGIHVARARGDAALVIGDGFAKALAA